ncbi:uncharacterized protein L201_007986 [Kwoniella dendrophila CBS 6074]|uniref:Trafficking protein particle complex II-specific subunit 65 IgD3 domain-containing protein n=1 Tax=Kwoniella dendrophila CBS 6074 TaxID=1295534 RepID=A0AAX4K627_9TREE
MPSPNPSAYYETLFHSSSLNLIIPEISSLPDEPTNNGEDLSSWWEGIESSNVRDTAFFDEKLFYFLSIHLPEEVLQGLPGTPALDAKEPTSELLRFLGRLQLTMTASFIPSLPPSSFNRSNQTSNSTSTPTATLPISNSASTLAPPVPPHTPIIPNKAGGDDGGESIDFSNPPITPNPFPKMDQGEEQYANIEGVVVWEGNVEEVSGPWEEDDKSSLLHSKLKNPGIGRKIIRSKDGWNIIWRGEVPIAYVRTQIQNPLLALTASVTLRDQTHTKTHRRNAQSIDTTSIRSGTTIRTDGTEYENNDENDDDDYAGMEQIDLLGGLAGGEDMMPPTRLAPSLRQDLSMPSESTITSPLPLSAITPVAASTIITPSTASSSSLGEPSRERGKPPTTIQPIISTTLRKSYRRILSLAPGLRVRMRTLFLPQLLTENAVQEEEENEKCIILCVEIENSPEISLENGFEVIKVNIEIGGKGGKAKTELIPQSPSQSNEKENQGQNNEVISFPLRLGSIEQYNLLYKVTIASSIDNNTSRENNINGLEEIVNRSLGRNDEIRPVSIIVIGKPYSLQSTSSKSNENKQEYKYQTKEFHSRWNCSLDLTPFYNSDQFNNNPNHNRLPKPSFNNHNSNNNNINNRNSKSNSLIASNQIQNNSIAGDKRYSLAHLLSVEREKELHQLNQQQQNRKPLMPSQMINGNQQNQRVTSLTSQRQNQQQQQSNQKEQNGLLVSIKLLPSYSSNNNSSNIANNDDRLSNKLGKSTIQPLETFSLEIFVHNKSDDVKRFRLNIPPRQNSNDDSVNVEHRMKEIWDKRRKKRNDDGEPDWGVDDIVLKQSLANYSSTSPSIIPLENDIRCGPLLPFTSLSTRIRFLALRKGTFKIIDQLRLISNDNDFEFTISPVLDIVIG